MWDDTVVRGPLRAQTALFHAPGTARVVRIVDGELNHESHQARNVLAGNPKFQLLFHAACHRRVNQIERIRKQLHDSVTCSHHWPTMDKSMAAVPRFLDAAQPFLGARPGDAWR